MVQDVYFIFTAHQQLVYPFICSPTCHHWYHVKM